MALPKDGVYDLKKLSLILLVLRLGCEFDGGFDDELRGGLLSQYNSSVFPRIYAARDNVLQRLISYNQKHDSDNQPLDTLFAALWNWMRENWHDCYASSSDFCPSNNDRCEYGYFDYY